MDRERELISQLKNISIISEESVDESPNSPRQSVDEKLWRLSYLKEQFESFELHNLFRTYTAKINHGFFSLFLILLTILLSIHLVVTVAVNSNSWDDLQVEALEIVLLVTAVALSVTGIFTVDRFVKRQKLRLLTIASCLVVYFLDNFLPLYHSRYVADDGRFRPTYTGFLILSCYIFFDIYNKWLAFLVAVFVTASGVAVRAVITYVDNEFLVSKILTDIITFTCMNVVGIYFRFMNEIAIRKSFLDRREFITTKLQLKHEKNQMENLMSNIIPKYLIDKVITNYIEKEMYYIKTRKILPQDPFKDTSTLLDEHENVSILFADIVHYTEMTQKLNITELLETLNDLFGEFDDISENLGVTRIKFLGDCYYCVAGLPPEPTQNHADATVELGLAMISVIAAVRRRRKLNIDMRIGVHSGRITSGIIGSLKYQFDIWSKDVDIANKMESEGCPGKVHITNKTKELLTKEYNIIPTDKGETVPQFKAHGLQTYFISPHEDTFRSKSGGPEPPPARSSVFSKNGLKKTKEDLLDYMRQQSIDENDETAPANDENPTRQLSIIEKNTINTINNFNLYETYSRSRRRYSNNPIRSSRVSERHALNGVKRRTAFMNNNIKRYGERKEAIHKEMEETVNNISFSKYKQYFGIKEINSVILSFKDNATEWAYIKMPDPLFKYYLVVSVILIFSIYLIEDITLLHNRADRWPFLAVLGCLLFVFLPTSWTYFLWIRYFSNSEVEPSNRILYYLCKCSQLITSNFVLRVTLYTFIFILTCLSATVELVACKDNFNAFVDNLLKKNRTLDSVRAFERPNCVAPWHITQICALTVMITFVFLRICIWIKLLYSGIVFALYGVLIYYFHDGFYELSESVDYNLEPRLAHLLVVAFIAITLHLIDRQTDYMNRLDFLVNQKIKNEQDVANGLKIINKKLLDNILPEHVAQIYMDVNREMKDLYFEEHQNVAIMFATLIYDEELLEMPEKKFLTIMNEYISKFDTLINRKQFCNIEKIKLAKWTYMAACGLKDREANMHATSSSLETLLNFASEMFKSLNEVNNFMSSTQLRMGICSGPIVAGVVGSKKPLYDIWGDAVNMASRMDSTGLPNHIQVMAHTADIIKGIGVECEYRGETFVKGKEGLVKTYFVKMDNDFNLIRTKAIIGEI